MFLNIGSGRGISHTLLFVLVSFLIVHLFSKRNFLISFPFFIGTFSHLILDLPEVPFFFPFVYYDFIYVEDPLSGWIYSLFNNPLVFFTELSGIIILIFILVYNRLFSFKKIIDFLLNRSLKQEELIK